MLRIAMIYTYEKDQISSIIKKKRPSYGMSGGFGMGFCGNREIGMGKIFFNLKTSILGIRNLFDIGIFIPKI